MTGKWHIPVEIVQCQTASNHIDWSIKYPNEMSLLIRLEDSGNNAGISWQSLEISNA